MEAKLTKLERPKPSFIDQLTAAVEAGEEYALRYSLDERELDALSLVQIKLEELAEQFEEKVA